MSQISEIQRSSSFHESLLGLILAVREEQVDLLPGSSLPAGRGRGALQDVAQLPPGLHWPGQSLLVGPSHLLSPSLRTRNISSFVNILLGTNQPVHQISALSYTESSPCPSRDTEREPFCSNHVSVFAQFPSFSSLPHLSHVEFFSSVLGLSNIF